ncbi:MAG: homocitrate synthase, partial [Candidatus Woesearchaeota archaeon]
MVRILDTTLREGEQCPGVSFNIDEKLQIARILDDFGVEMIEAGDPSVSPKTMEAVKRIANMGLNAEIVAHSLATKKGMDKALECGVDRVVVLFPTSGLHLKTKIGMSQDEAIAKVVETVEYAKAHGLKVRYSPEDATRTDFDYLVRACNEAIEAGADRVSICDTLGVARPDLFFKLIKQIKESLKTCDLDVHCHNDFGLAVANGLAAVRAGADCVHTTVNGIGERAGIPDMAEMVLALYTHASVKNNYKLENLPEISKYVEKVSGVFMHPIKPIVGQNAFSHKCGVHTNGVLKNPKNYESIDPALVGRERKIVVDKYTGKRAVASKLAEYGIAHNDEQLTEIVNEIKRVGDERKLIHEADIIEIAETVTGAKTSIIPKLINALVLISVDSAYYTSTVVRRLRNFKGVHSVFEITGDHDISAYIKVGSIAELNNAVEEMRTMPGIKTTSTKIVL